jgi:hypothetical protein
MTPRCARGRRSLTTIKLSGERKRQEAGPRTIFLGLGVVAYTPNPVGLVHPWSRARAKAGGSFPHMDDAPAVAAEVVIVARKGRADRGEGLARGADVHKSFRAGAVGGGVIA